MEFEPNLLIGDCREVMGAMFENSIDLIVTSPPYNCKIKYDIWDDERSYEEYLVFTEEWLRAAYRVLKDDGRIAVNVSYEINQKERGGRVFVASDVWQIMKKIGFKWNGLADLRENMEERIKYTAWGSWMSASAPYIYCMDGNTPIITIAGLKRLHEITNEDKVLSHAGNFCNVSGIYNRMHHEDIIELTVSNNLAEPIRCTKEHMFMVRKRNTVFNVPPRYRRSYVFSDSMWVSAGELHDNINFHSGRKDDVRYYVGFPKIGVVPIPIEYDTEQMYNPNFWKLVGLFLAEGSLVDMSGHISGRPRSRGWRINITSHINELETIKEIIRINGYNFSVHTSKENHACRLEISNKQLWNFLLEFFAKGSHEVKGTKAHLKCIPEWVLSLPDNCLQEFVGGYFFGDGNTFPKRNTVGYSIISNSIYVLYQIQRILLKFGKYATVYKFKPPHEYTICGRSGITKQSYIITWYDNPTNLKPLIDDGGYLWFMISDISSIPSQLEVFDLTVDGDHTYCTPTAIVHNSPKECVLIACKKRWKKDTPGTSTMSKEQFMEIVKGEWAYRAETQPKTPACFSLDLPIRAVNVLSYVGDTVLDPFCGRGTTGAACKLLGRNFIGIDISPNYIEIAKNEIHRMALTKDINDLVKDLNSGNVIIPNLPVVKDYLTLHPDFISVIRDSIVNLQNVTEKSNTQFSLEMRYDPEIANHSHLNLYVRQKKYDDDIMDKIWAVRDSVSGRLWDECGGFVLITTDLQTILDAPE